MTDASGSSPARSTRSTKRTSCALIMTDRTFAIYRSPDDTFHATDGLCTHERAHLADGLVMGDTIECPKHNGRFNYKSGEAKRAPGLRQPPDLSREGRRRTGPDRHSLSGR